MCFTNVMLLDCHESRIKQADTQDCFHPSVAFVLCWEGKKATTGYQTLSFSLPHTHTHTHTHRERKRYRERERWHCKILICIVNTAVFSSYPPSVFFFFSFFFFFFFKNPWSWGEEGVWFSFDDQRLKKLVAHVLSMISVYQDDDDDNGEWSYYWISSFFVVLVHLRHVVQ